MRSLDDLLDEATLGKLTKEEIQHVVSRIKECTPDNDKDLYGFLLALGRAAAGTPMMVQHRKLVERFLVYPSYSMISRIAFIVLCDWWGLMQLDKIWTYLDKSGSFCVDFPRNHQLKN